MFDVENYGYGAGLRSKHFQHLLEHPPTGVEVFEVLSENYFGPGGKGWHAIEKLKDELPLVLHGVSLAIGNSSDINTDYLKKLKVLIQELQPKLISDHLCWGGFGGHNSHDLLPLPYTKEAIKHIATKVKKVQDYLGMQIMLENVSSYVSFVESEMTEWEFLVEIAEQADCGILLDVNNIFVSAFNHGFDAKEYIRNIPSERVGQYHIAGHTNNGDWILDSHIGPIPQGVWDLFQTTVQILGEKTTIIEWDEDIPSFEELADESIRAKTLAKESLQNMNHGDSDG